VPLDLWVHGAKSLETRQYTRQYMSHALHLSKELPLRDKEARSMRWLALFSYVMTAIFGILFWAFIIYLFL
jgi:hypothetical protein